jgi:hypothetical protein
MMGAGATQLRRWKMTSSHGTLLLKDLVATFKVSCSRRGQSDSLFASSWNHIGKAGGMASSEIDVELIQNPLLHQRVSTMAE